MIWLHWCHGRTWPSLVPNKRHMRAFSRSPMTSNASAFAKVAFEHFLPYWGRSYPWPCPRRCNDAFTILRDPKYYWTQHQDFSFSSCWFRKWYYGQPFVTIKVRIERQVTNGCKRMARPSTNLRHKGLDAQTVQGRRTVQENRMIFNNSFNDVPDTYLWRSMSFSALFGFEEMPRFTISLITKGLNNWIAISMEYHIGTSLNPVQRR